MRKDVTVEKYIEAFYAAYTNYQTYWNYEDGCVLMGSVQLFDATGEEKYIKYVIDYLNKVIDNDGVITNYEVGKHNIDGFNCGKVLFRAYEYSKDEKFRKAIDFLMKNLMEQPRTKAGNFWHKAIYPNQVWLDGLYMAQPFYMEYETKYNNKNGYNDIVSQFTNVYNILRDQKTGLYFHGYDESKTAFWADKQTGLSKNFWLRSIGWYLIALIDTIDAMTEELYEQYRALIDIFKEAITAVLKYQDTDTKLFYQVVDKAEVEGNYTETSGSSMIAYAIMKGARLGVLNPEKYEKVGVEIFDAIVEHKLIDGRLTDICKVAGLGPENNPARDGSVEYYISEPKTCDDAKGSGPFIMAYAQKLLLK